MARPRKARSAAVLSLVWLTAFAPAVSAGEASSRPTIEALESSLQRRSTSGDVVRFDGESLQSFAVASRPAATVGDAGPIVRALDIADGQEPFDAQGTVSVARLGTFPVTALLKADRWYGFENCPPRTIAGRNARCARVVPKDPHRLGYTLWVDAEQDALLGFVIHETSGATLEYVQFSRVIVDLTERPLSNTPDVQTTIAVAQEVPRWTPDGFVLQSNERSDREHVMRFSDGVAGFSIFVTPVADSATTTGESRWGASAIVDRIVRGGDGRDFLVTLAGEIPMATARRILLGVQPSF